MAEMGISLKHLPDGSSTKSKMLRSRYEWKIAFGDTAWCFSIHVHIFSSYFFPSRSLTRH
jgi:hypothetical protein